MCNDLRGLLYGAAYRKGRDEVRDFRGSVLPVFPGFVYLCIPKEVLLGARLSHGVRYRMRHLSIHSHWLMCGKKRERAVGGAKPLRYSGLVPRQKP